MYGLDINFLKDRPEYQPDARPAAARATGGGGNVLPLLGGIAVGILPLAVVGVMLLFLRVTNSNLSSEISNLNSELSNLDTQLQQVGNISNEIGQIEAETKQLASAFNQIKPWSAMLQEISNNYPPGVRIGTILQVKERTRRRKSTSEEPQPEKIEIVGIANKFDDVNDFLLLLQDSPFFDPNGTQIIKAELIEEPSQSEYYTISIPEEVSDLLPDFVEYRIRATLTGVPASELIQALERTGTVGLVSRIKVLQQEGIIKQ